MAKGQKRSSREQKKAKQNKPKPPVAGSAVSVLQTKPTAPVSGRTK
jgi:hypothetical protein